MQIDEGTAAVSEAPELAAAPNGDSKKRKRHEGETAEERAERKRKKKEKKEKKATKKGAEPEDGE